jgi:hypothetical protein
VNPQPSQSPLSPRSDRIDCSLLHGLARSAPRPLGGPELRDRAIPSAVLLMKLTRGPGVTMLGKEPCDGSAETAELVDLQKALLVGVVTPTGPKCHTPIITDASTQQSDRR